MLNQHVGKVGVQISEKQGSVKYIDTSLEDVASIRVRRHSSEEFVRFQATSDDQWSRKYYYLLCCVLIGTGHDVFPIMMQFVVQLSGGSFTLLLLGYSLIIGSPIIYMETFLGRYTKLTNCQMYRMAPLFFGVCFVIFVINAAYQPVLATNAALSLVNMLKLLANPDINTKCLDEIDECYDYVKKGKINDTCKYGYISMICEKHGEIRYLMEYQYWKTFKDPSSTKFPYNQIITGVVITWMVILAIVMKKLQVLGWIVHVAFIIHLMTLTMIFFLALLRDGGTQGLNALVKVNLNKFDFFRVLVVQWYSVSRLGLIIPTGYMTFSAYAKFSNQIGTESFLIAVGSVVLAGYYLAIFFAVCGVLADTMGVDVEAVIIPDKGLYLAVVPQFLVQLQMPNIFLVIYYGALWFIETVKIAFYVHMLVLNLYDYFPTLKNFSTYIWVTTCLVLCLLSIPSSEQFTNTLFIPIIWNLYVMVGFALCITLEVTMVSYFYGVNRLCDDIHFMTGHKPMQFLRIMWYVIPFIGWCSIICMLTMMKKSFFGGEHMIHQDSLELGWLYGNLSAVGCVILIVISTVMYIAFRFGHPNLLMTLLKPQYFWGPSERDIRIERKNFCPLTNIRSQQFRSRMKNENDHFDTIQQDGLLLSKFSRDVLIEQAGRGDVLKDKLFFENIGIFSHMKTYVVKKSSFSKERERELDVQDNK